MENVLFHWILLGIFIKVTGSVEISDSQSGSKTCNMTLRLNPSPVLFSKYQSLEIFKHPDRRSDYTMHDCDVLSVRLKKRFGRETTLRRNVLGRMLTKKDNTRLQLIVQHHEFKHLPMDEVFVLVELGCKGRRCYLHSADSINKENIIPSSWVIQNRKLLSFKTDNDVNSVNLPITPILLAVAGIITLIVALALCSHSDTSREKAVSDEVGGTEVGQQHVVAVKIEDALNSTPLERSGANESQSSENIRRNTTESKKSEVTVQRASQSVTENGEVIPTGRTTSQSSQTDKRSVGEVVPRLVSRSTGSRGSVDKIEDVALGSSPEKRSDSTGHSDKERKRAGSEKEAALTEKDSKESNSSNEARTRTDSSEGAKKGVFRIPSRKRQGSGGKEPKSSNEHEEKTKFWQRRKSSKTKINLENNDNPSPKKEKKKKKSESKNNYVPETVPSATTRPTADLPLPPRPTSVGDEEAQYEVVETRAERSRSKDAAVCDYETVTTSKTRKYDKVNVRKKDQTRPPSELYECINDDDSKMKRISSGSHQYDIVETRTPPKKGPVSLEYAYAVVASRDKPMIPTESSGNSDLYEVVTDDIKQQSGVVDTRTSGAVVEDDYAIVQKDPSKKRSFKTSDDNLHSQSDKQNEKSRSGDMHPAPAPPPVSSLIHVATSSSVRRRTQSEGDDLNVERPDSPIGSTSPRTDRPQTMFEIEETYAKVDMSMKKRHSVENQGHEFAPVHVVPEGFYEEEADTPPPVPSSLYAELESVRKDGDEQNESQKLQTQNDDDNAYEEVATKAEIKSITSRHTVSDMKISQSKERASSPDPNGVLRKLKPPSGSPRISGGSDRYSGHSIDSDNRLSIGSYRDYDEVVTKNNERTQPDKRSSKELTVPSGNDSDSASGHYESIETATNGDSSHQDGTHLNDVVIERNQVTTHVTSHTTEAKIVTYV